MNRLAKLLFFAVLLSTEASADKIKEVIISGQSSPLDVQIMPDAPVTLDPDTHVFTTPVQIPPARIRPFSLDPFGSVRDKHIVSRDSILKFVNFTIFNASTPGDNLVIHCQWVVELSFPPPNDKEKILLALIQVRPEVIQIISGTGIGANFPTVHQLLTGDILVPAGSTLAVRDTAQNNHVCEAMAYGILFEQE